MTVRLLSQGSSLSEGHQQPCVSQYLHLLLQLMQELSVGSQRRDAGRALGGEDGSGDVLQTLLQRDLRAAHTTQTLLTTLKDAYKYPGT